MVFGVLLQNVFNIVRSKSPGAGVLKEEKRRKS